MTTEPLAGVRVLEVANWVAAPSCCALMADMGADVLKVEPPFGDAMRGRLRQPRVADGEPTLDAPWQNDNRGKRSIAVDLDKPQGGELVRTLARHVDVLVTNLLPERQTRFGLTPQDVWADNPSLVYGVVSAYGTKGEEADRTGFDVTAFFMRAGVSALIADTAPPRSRAGQGDHVAALALLSGILAALRVRDATGRGQVVEVSLLHTGIWTIACDMSSALVDGLQPPRRSRLESLNPLGEAFACADGSFIQLAAGPDDWPRVCAVIGRDDLNDDERFATARDRAQHGRELVELLDGAFATRTRDDWARTLAEAQLRWSTYATLADIAADAQVRANGIFESVQHPAVGSYQAVAAPFRLSGSDVRVRGRAPDTDEHTDEVLASLGLGPAEIEELRASGVVGKRAREARVRSQTPPVTA